VSVFIGCLFDSFVLLALRACYMGWGLAQGELQPNKECPAIGDMGLRSELKRRARYQRCRAFECFFSVACSQSVPCMFCWIGLGQKVLANGCCGPVKWQFYGVMLLKHLLPGWGENKYMHLCCSIMKHKEGADVILSGLHQ